LTPREFWNALEGNYEHYQNLQREDWVRDRFFTTVLVNIQAARGSQIEPRDLITFDWEKSKQVDLPTEEDMQRIIERDKKMLKCQS
jgi:hypothetical protein